MEASIDARDLQRALKVLAPELQKATNKKLRDLAKEVPDDVRKAYPSVRRSVVTPTGRSRPARRLASPISR